MTREEFVRAFAQRHKVSDRWADLGFVDIGGTVRIAMPCACDGSECTGWDMVSPSSIHDHLLRAAPGPLRSAYATALHTSEKVLPRFVAVIFANGRDDDGAGVAAAFNNEPVQMGGFIYEPGDDIIIKGKTLLITDPIKAGKPGRYIEISNCFIRQYPRRPTAR